MRVYYKAKGLVFGKLWGGGAGFYPSRSLTGKSLAEITKQANEGLDGSLDSGMGFERLIGAALAITKTTFVTVKGKVYSREESYLRYYGTMSKRTKHWLKGNILE